MITLSETRRAYNGTTRSLIVLDRKKARGCSLKPWSLLLENDQTGGLVSLYNSARTFFQSGAL